MSPPPSAIFSRRCSPCALTLSCLSRHVPRFRARLPVSTVFKPRAIKPPSGALYVAPYRDVRECRCRRGGWSGRGAARIIVSDFEREGEMAAIFSPRRTARDNARSAPCASRLIGRLCGFSVRWSTRRRRRRRRSRNVCHTAGNLTFIGVSPASSPLNSREGSPVCNSWPRYGSAPSPCRDPSHIYVFALRSGGCEASPFTQPRALLSTPRR